MWSLKIVVFVQSSMHQIHVATCHTFHSRTLPSSSALPLSHSHLSFHQFFSAAAFLYTALVSIIGTR